MCDIYTRNFGRDRRYSPPPGYDGNAFGSDIEREREVFASKAVASFVETENKEVLSNENEAPAEAIFPIQPERHHPTEKENGHNEEKNSIEAIISGLRSSLGDKIGSEEVILLLVILLISMDGISAEVLMLALVLLAY